MSGFNQKAQNPNVTASSGIGQRTSTKGFDAKAGLTGMKKKKEESNRAESCDAYDD